MIFQASCHSLISQPGISTLHPLPGKAAAMCYQRVSAQKRCCCPVVVLGEWRYTKSSPSLFSPTAKPAMGGRFRNYSASCSILTACFLKTCCLWASSSSARTSAFLEPSCSTKASRPWDFHPSVRCRWTWPAGSQVTWGERGTEEQQVHQARFPQEGWFRQASKVRTITHYKTS